MWTFGPLGCSQVLEHTFANHLWRWQSSDSDDFHTPTLIGAVSVVKDRLCYTCPHAVLTVINAGHVDYVLNSFRAEFWILPLYMWFLCRETI